MMKTFLIFVGLQTVLISMSFAVTSATAAKISEKVGKIISKSGLSQSHLGLVAKFEGKDLVSINSNKRFIPASITKLVTAAAVIRHFPPGFKFKTQLATIATKSGSSLKGDLYLIGGGDPSFVSENLWYLVNVFTRSEVKTIEGDIVVDDSLFDQLRFDPSRQKERVDRAYDAPVGAMSFNWNSVNIFVRPGDHPGDPAKVFADPENEYIRLKSTVKTAKSSTSVSADRAEDDDGLGDLLKVSGSIAVGAKELVIYKNITQPDLWAGANLKSFLAQRGISVKGKIRSGKAPAGARVLAEGESKLIHDILTDMNKFSNNYIAEMLTKGISASESSPGSIDKGMIEIRKYLSGLGVPSADFELVNPSGLTRKNEMTPSSLWKVLEDMRSQFLYQPEFMITLPIAGIDGTLKKRFKEGRGERWVRAKTGFLTGVVSLAGYAGRSDGTVIPFVFICNGSADENHVRSVFDQIAVALVETDD